MREAVVPLAAGVRLSRVTRAANAFGCKHLAQSIFCALGPACALHRNSPLGKLSVVIFASENIQTAVCGALKNYGVALVHN